MTRQTALLGAAAGVLLVGAGALWHTLRPDCGDVLRAYMELPDVVAFGGCVRGGADTQTIARLSYDIPRPSAAELAAIRSALGVERMVWECCHSVGKPGLFLDLGDRPKPARLPDARSMEVQLVSRGCEDADPAALDPDCAVVDYALSVQVYGKI
jgi:hypothetical protein